jgi:hypothetical protein
VARKLRLSYADPLPGKDFYINLGARHGVKPGDRLVVQRVLTTPDAMSEQAMHVIPVTLGEILVVAVGDSACIGRQDTQAGSAALPFLQYPGFMVGDDVSLKSGLPLGPSIP